MLIFLIQHNLTPISLAKIGEHNYLVDELSSNYDQCLPSDHELEAMMESDIVSMLE